MTETGKRIWEKQSISMDTLVTIQIVTSTLSKEVAGELIDSALSSFYDVEQICSRFDPTSEVMRLTKQPGIPVPLSSILFEAIRFACSLAEMTDGQFDPTIGRQLEQFGFNRHYLTGEMLETTEADPSVVSFRDIGLDESQRTVILQKPVVLDLGAVAKGLAIDMAAHALRSVPDIDGFVVNAGGDVYVAGVNERDELWKIGIRHPERSTEMLYTLSLTDVSVCTSGDYERKSTVSEQTHHILVPGTGQSQNEVSSCTVIAPYAMMADALSTAAFVLGPVNGMDFLTSCDVEGLMVTTEMDIQMTRHMRGYIDG